MRGDVPGEGLDEAALAGERRAVVLRLGEVGVGCLGESLRSAGRHRLAPDQGRDRDPGEDEHEQRHEQRPDRRELDLARLDLLPEVLRCSPDRT